jgi:cytochrome P450
VYHNAQYGFWALSRYDDVAPAMTDFETYSSAKGVSLDLIRDLDATGPVLLHHHDGPSGSHTNAHAGQQGLHPVGHRHPGVDGEGGVTESIDPTSFDAVEEFSALFPVEVITAMLGVPAEDRQQLRESTRKDGPHGGLHRVVAVFCDVLPPLVVKRRADPRDPQRPVDYTDAQLPRSSASRSGFMAS